MKRRKPPVLLATCLVLMLVAVGIIYSPKSGDDGHGHSAAAHNAPPPAAEKGDRPKVNAGQVANMAKGAMTAPIGEGGPGRPAGAGPASAPSIAASKPVNYKPQPNDSSTSTQWYTDQTGKK